MALTDHVNTLTLDFQTPDYEKWISVIYNPLSLWYFVIAAPTD